MCDTIQIPYSKNFGYFGLTLIVGLIIMYLPYLIEDIKADYFHDWIFVATFDFIFLLISGIRFVSSGSSLGIAIDIKDKDKIQENKTLFNNFQSFLAQLFFGTPVVIADKFIQGSDKEIFAQIIVYFEQRKNCT